MLFIFEKEEFEDGSENKFGGSINVELDVSMFKLKISASIQSNNTDTASSSQLKVKYHGDLILGNFKPRFFNEPSSSTLDYTINVKGQH